MYETLKILENLKDCHPKTIIQNAGVRDVGNYTMWIEKETVENIKPGLFYLLYDIGLEIGINVNKGRLEKEIFGKLILNRRIK